MKDSTLIIPYAPAHLPLLDLQPCQKMWQDFICDPRVAENLGHSSAAFTALRGGRVLGCAGFQEIWSGRAIAWALFSGNIGGGMISICRKIKQELANTHFRRVEAAVLPALELDAAGRPQLPRGQENGHLLVDMMGFQLETVHAKNYTEDGQTASIYVWLKEG